MGENEALRGRSGAVFWNKRRQVLPNRRRSQEKQRQEQSQGQEPGLSLSHVPCRLNLF